MVPEGMGLQVYPRKLNAGLYLVTPQATQAQVVCHMILRNSGHSEIVRVCMGIFTICFRKHKYYKILNKIPYLTSMVSYLLSVPLLSQFVAIFASWKTEGAKTRKNPHKSGKQGTDSK